LAAKDLEELDRLEKKHGLRMASVSERLNEKFEMSMEIDRLCALVEPAMKEADKEQGNPRFAELQRELDSLTSKPRGAGVDLPLWLRRLEQEVQRMRSLQSADALLSEGFVQVAQIQLSWEEVQRQIKDWLPAAEGS
jgi:cobalamin biosynthesis protein CobT